MEELSKELLTLTAFNINPPQNPNTHNMMDVPLPARAPRRAVSILAAESLIGIAQPSHETDDAKWEQMLDANGAELRAIGAALPPAALAALCDDSDTPLPAELAAVA